MKLSQPQLEEIKARNSCKAWAERWVKLRRHGKKWIGPCPLHSPDPQATDSTGFECDEEGWVCAVCPPGRNGGDVIKLVMLREQVDFNRAIELLGGATPAPQDPEAVKRAEEELARKRALRDAESDRYRQRERDRARGLARYGKPLPGTPGEAYLRQARGVDFPPDVRLRCDLQARFYVPDEPKPRLLHTGPALLAVMERGGKFMGVHTTWIDLAQPKGKAVITDPATGTRLDVKKMRGSKKGCHIELIAATDAHTLVIGEGTEKVLAVWTAYKLAGRPLEGIAWWTSADLGNLGGKAASSLPHPFLKTEKQRPLRVGSAEPDFTAPAIEIPPSVTRVIILGDSTSDRFSTQMTIARAAARWARPGLDVVAAWSPEGNDFDDLLREANG